ncbi:MAG: heme-binding protein [Planctomycetes bacterium]|nr:heme-binding protein [Planctomycetota bacterium]MBI3843709.1 heme-binding protein [Planctomycetota bacterium]
MKPSFLRPLSLVAALALAAGTASAQVVEKKALTLAGAKKLIAAAEAEAKRLNAPGGVIAVVDDGGNLMALERLDDTFAAGAKISIGKARTAVLFKKPTKAFEDIIKNGRTAMVALEDFTPLQGGIPIEVDGKIVGGIGVSGAASAAQDEELAIAGANAAKTLTSDSTGRIAPAKVSYLAGNSVAAAFAKGQPLLEVDGYKVHASRRDSAGVAEVHVRDTDILYVLDGSATLVTGGSVVDGKTVATDEIRGTSIQGGEKQRIAKGDVMVVPHGTPHWFQEVSAPLLYYVVKVDSCAGGTN